MRVFAAVLAVALLAIPFAACGGGGGGCSGNCGGCFTASDCCGFGSGAVCSNQTISGAALCNFGDFTCKLGS